MTRRRHVSGQNVGTAVERKTALTVAALTMATRTVTRLGAAALGAWLVCSAATTVAAPVSAGNAPRSAALKTAFEEMYNEPSNLDKAFRFAEVAARSGDFEGAISALERMLIFNPKLPRVRLELGVLYYRLGSNEMARSYFRQVLEANDAPADVRERVKTFMQNMDEREATHTTSGALTLGFRYQANANAGPDSPNVRLFGGLAHLTDQYTQRSDVNLFAAASFTHVYNLKTDPSLYYESTLSLFGTRQRDQSGLNTQVIDVRTGPRLNTDLPFLDEARLMPFFNVGHVRLGGDPYLNYHGVGINLRGELTEWAALELEELNRQRFYRNSTAHRDADARDGLERHRSAILRVIPHENGMVTLTADFGRQYARDPSQQSRERGGGFGYALSYGPPLNLTEGAWTTGVNVTWTLTHYDKPNNLIDPTVRRFDRERRLSLLTSIPVRKDITLTLLAQRTIVSSNLPNFTNDDTLFSLAGTWRF